MKKILLMVAAIALVGGAASYDVQVS